MAGEELTPPSPPRTANIAIIGSGRAATTALHALQERGYRAELSRHPSPEQSLDWYAGWLRGCDVCLFAADVVTPLALRRVNETCLDQRVPLLPGLVMGAVGQVGPLVIAGQGPCLGCLDLRVRTVTLRSPFPPPVAADPNIAERVGRALAEEIERGDTGHVQYLWESTAVMSHPLLRAPGCPDCGAIAPHLPFRSPGVIELRSEQRSDPDQIIRLTPRLVDAVTGPIKTLTQYAPGENDPALQHWIAALADPTWESFGHNTLYCGGSALMTEVAQAAALGEAVERASTCTVSFDDVLIARYRDIESEAVDPLRWDLFHERTRAKPGFPYAAISRDVELSWVWGYSLVQERPVRVPASRVFSPFRIIAAGDNFDTAIISGYSTGCTIEEAVYGAMMEVIERDAFMIAWANQLRVPRLAVDASTPGEVGEYIAAFAERDIEVRCLLIDLDLGAHAVVAIARHSRTGEPAFVVAAAADIDAAVACKRALKELSANRLSVRYEMTQGSPPQPDPETAIDERAHGQLYARPEAAPWLDFWWSAPESAELPPAQTCGVTTATRRCVETISKAGLEVIAVDLTAPAISSLGLRTVKVLIPGAYPMLFDGRFPHFGGTRITNAPVAVGLRHEPLAFEDLCTFPHPFP